MSEQSPSAATVAEASIARVLAAERSARDAVAQANQDAKTLEERARAEARSLAERTERRINAIRLAFDARARAEVAAIEAQASTGDANGSLSQEDMLRLDRAMAAMAAELSGPA